MAELWPVLVRIVRLTWRFRRGEITPERMFDFETALSDRWRELGRRMMQWAVKRLQPKERQGMPSTSQGFPIPGASQPSATNPEYYFGFYTPVSIGNQV